MKYYDYTIKELIERLQKFGDDKAKVFIPHENGPFIIEALLQDIDGNCIIAIRKYKQND